MATWKSGPIFKSLFRQPDGHRKAVHHLSGVCGRNRATRNRQLHHLHPCTNSTRKSRLRKTGSPPTIGRRQGAGHLQWRGRPSAPKSIYTRQSSSLQQRNRLCGQTRQSLQFRKRLPITLDRSKTLGSASKKRSFRKRSTIRLSNEKKDGRHLHLQPAVCPCENTLCFRSLCSNRAGQQQKQPCLDAGSQCKLEGSSSQSGGEQSIQQQFCRHANISVGRRGLGKGSGRDQEDCQRGQCHFRKSQEMGEKGQEGREREENGSCPMASPKIKNATKTPIFTNFSSTASADHHLRLGGRRRDYTNELFRRQDGYSDSSVTQAWTQQLINDPERNPAPGHQHLEPSTPRFSNPMAKMDTSDNPVRRLTNLASLARRLAAANSIIMPTNSQTDEPQQRQSAGRTQPSPAFGPSRMVEKRTDNDNGERVAWIKWMSNNGVDVPRILVNMIHVLMFLLLLNSSIPRASASPPATSAVFSHESNIYWAQEIVHVPILLPINDITASCKKFKVPKRLKREVRFDIPKDLWGNLETSRKNTDPDPQTFRKQYVRWAFHELQGVCQEFFVWKEAFFRPAERQRRGVMKVGMKALKTVFGILGNLDIKTIKQTIAKIPWKHRGQTDSFAKQLARLNATLTSMSQQWQVANRKQQLDVLRLQFIQYFSSLRARAHSIQTGLQLARHGQLSPSLVNITTAGNILKAVNNFLKKGRDSKISKLQPVAEVAIELYDCPVSVVSFDNQVQLWIHIPIANRKAKLYQYLTVPFQWQNHNESKILRVVHQHDAIAINEPFYATLDANLLRKCWSIREKEIVCHRNLPLKTDTAASCARAMFKSELKEVKRSCKLEQVRELTLVQLSNAFTVFSPVATSVEIACPGSQSSKESLSPGLVTRSLDPGCSARSDKFWLYQPDSLLVPESVVVRLEWSPQEFTKDVINHMLGLSDVVQAQFSQVNNLEDTVREIQVDASFGFLLGIGSLTSSIGIILVLSLCGVMVGCVKQKKRFRQGKTENEYERPRIFQVRNNIGVGPSLWQAQRPPLTPPRRAAPKVSRLSRATSLPPRSTYEAVAHPPENPHIIATTANIEAPPQQWQSEILM